jgi:hypothetical protein
MRHQVGNHIGMRHQVGNYLRKYLAELIDFKLLNVIVWRNDNEQPKLTFFMNSILLLLTVIALV